jgi:hypothetical protein
VDEEERGKYGVVFKSKYRCKISFHLLQLKPLRRGYLTQEMLNLDFETLNLVY